MLIKKKKVLAFGVFDKFHDGHRYFLTQAKALGHSLVVVVAQDEMVISLKKRPPVFSLDERIEKIMKEKIADEVVQSDSEPNKWDILKKIKPDIVAIGYDQETLRRALEESRTLFSFEFEIESILPYQSHILHSSLLKD